MKRTRLALLLLALMLAAAFVVGCAPQPQETSADDSLPDGTETPAADPTPDPTPDPTVDTAPEMITVTDMKGREIALDAPAEKVVALMPGDCEILYAIGAGDMLVGRGEYCDYPAQVLDIPVVQTGANTNIEQIIALGPQVVIMSTMGQTEEQVASLEAAGIKVVVSDAKDIAGVYTAIELIGAVTGKEEEAAAVVADMEAVFADVSAKAAGNGEKTIYFEASPLEYGLWAAGSGTFMDEMAAMLGLTNAFADVDDYKEISQEQVIDRDPDYIVAIAMYFGEGPTPEEEILGRDGWQDIKAIQNGAVLNFGNNEIARPGPRLADAARMLYEFIYENEALDSAA